MKKIVVGTMLTVFLSISNAYAIQKAKVDHCDYDEQTYIETCYGTDGQLLNGWAVEGNQPKSSVNNRRKIRKLIKAQKHGEGDNEEIAQELKEAKKPYTLSKFHNGRKIGVSRDIDAYNYTVKRVEYTKGKKDGRYEVYYPNHNLRATATYKDGVLDGSATFYNSHGRKIGKSRYKKGILIEGFCRDRKGDKIALPTDGKTVVTEVKPCVDVIDTD